MPSMLAIGRLTAVLCTLSAAFSQTIHDRAREVISRRCLGCHSAQAKTAGLDLSAGENAHAAAAKLLARVQAGTMPPGKALPPEEVETLRQWSNAGAPQWSSPIAARRSGADWWAWQPIAVKTPPGEGGVDGWIHAKLASKGLEMAPAAGRRTLIRRVSFGLTGLPPAPEEVEAFVQDKRPGAYERVVDRLLASPRYGEHWARHWLDIVRYAESEGFERDWLRDHVWPYRDYVIRSFNSDKPYAQFVREQIAGDVIEPSTRDAVVASSFLVLGPTDAVGLTSAVPQERAMVRADQLEEMVGLVSQTFLGLTVNCARCHDHKFDPIPQRDYYKMKAVFDSVWQPTYGDELRAGGRPLLTRPEAAAYQSKREVALARVRELEAAVAAEDRKGHPRPKPAVSDGLVAQWTLDTDARDEVAALHPASTPEEALFEDGRLRPAAGKDSVTVTTVPLAGDIREKTLEAWVVLKLRPEKGTTLFRIRNRSGFRGAAVDGIHFAGGKKLQWENTSTVRFRTEDVDGPPEESAPGSRIQMAITYAADGEIRIYRNGQLYGRAYRPDSGTAHGRLQTYGKDDAIVELTSGNGFELEEARLYGRVLSAGEVAQSFAAGVINVGPAANEQRTQLARQLADAKRDWKAMPEPAKAFSVEVHQAEPTRLLLRGDVNRPGDVMVPAGVSLLRTAPGDLGLAPDAPDGERRRKFADWLVSPDNPLFARVMVNRVWHYHFGAGLVESPNDFGYNGGIPSHPELLDWLASEFLKSGGSIKQLQKLIVMSAAYRQSSRFDSTAAAQDAGARLLWRFPPQRLPAEAVRDAMLTASGGLNEEMFGPSFRPFQIIKNAGSYHSYDPVDSTEFALQRRTVYRMNVNSGGNPMLDALDCPLPSVKTPKRSSTTTALQALSLMNNPFVDRMAKSLAARLEREARISPDRVTRAYELVLARPPRPEEIDSASALIAEAGLAQFCWALFNTSEFSYVQ